MYVGVLRNLELLSFVFVCCIFSLYKHFFKTLFFDEHCIIQTKLVLASRDFWVREEAQHWDMGVLRVIRTFESPLDISKQRHCQRLGCRRNFKSGDIDRNGDDGPMTGSGCSRKWKGLRSLLSTLVSLLRTPSTALNPHNWLVDRPPGVAQITSTVMRSMSGISTTIASHHHKT